MADEQAPALPPDVSWITFDTYDGYGRIYEVDGKGNVVTPVKPLLQDPFALFMAIFYWSTAAFAALMLVVLAILALALLMGSPNGC